MNKLQCPYCSHDMCLEVETKKILEYGILERIETFEKDGTPGAPTFLLNAPKEIPSSSRYNLIRCTHCLRRYFEIARELKLNESKLQVILENFTEAKFKSYDTSVKDSTDPKKFVLKQRPKELCKV